jgi:DNA-binding transcriptional ArsR family regulator
MDTALDDLGGVFKVLVHPTRLAILEILRQGEECVCHMEATLGLRQAYISQQLSVLREAGLVRVRRDGWNIFYQVTRPEVYDVLDAARALLPKSSQKRMAAVVLVPKSGSCECPKCQVQVAV